MLKLSRNWLIPFVKKSLLCDEIDMDLYCRMGHELRSLFKDLFVPGREKVVKAKINKILELASEIGGSIQGEAETLKRDVENYLKQTDNRAMIAVLKKHALRLEQETREI